MNQNRKSIFPHLSLSWANRQPTLVRLIVLGLGSLLIGIIVNGFHSRGIHWKILLLSLPGLSQQAGWHFVSSDEAFASFLQDHVIFVDSRPRDDYEIDHIPGARSVPFFDYFRNPAMMNQEDAEARYILYDQERNSRQVRLLARQLARDGYRQVTVMRGGFVEWLYKGYPSEKGDAR